MKLKRMSLRFNLDNKADRKAWDSLEILPDSKNKAVITAINSYFDNKNEVAEIIRQTIKECLKDISVIGATSPPTETLSEDENFLLDSLNDFLGD